MDKVNQTFQDLLLQHQFPMKAIEEDNQWVYRGKLSISPTYLVDFAVSLAKSDKRSTCQIVFNNLAYCSAYENRDKWLNCLNSINVNQGLYYYFALDGDGRVFARYIGEVSTHLDELFYILINGGKIVRSALQVIESMVGVL